MKVAQKKLLAKTNKLRTNFTTILNKVIILVSTQIKMRH